MNGRPILTENLNRHVHRHEDLFSSFKSEIYHGFGVAAGGVTVNGVKRYPLMCGPPLGATPEGCPSTRGAALPGSFEIYIGLPLLPSGGEGGLLDPPPAFAALAVGAAGPLMYIVNVLFCWRPPEASTVGK